MVVDFIKYRISACMVLLGIFYQSAIAQQPPEVKNVVLVHGAFVDSRGWEMLIAN